MNSIRLAYRWLADCPHQCLAVRMLQGALGLMLLFRLSTEARFFHYLWGPSGIGSGSTVFVLGPSLGRFADSVFASNNSTALLLCALGLGALGLIFGVRTRLATLLALSALFLLDQRMLQLTDGGDNVTKIVLTYMLFVLPSTQASQRGTLGVWLHNIAILAIATQICLLYEVSGLMKAYGDKWHHGIAMYYVSNVEWYSLPEFRYLFKNPLITTIATYVPLFYELWFPMAMLSRIRLYWLALGILFHLSIAVFMGLVSFSIVMIGLELFLIRDSEYRSLILKFKSHFKTKNIDALDSTTGLAEIARCRLSRE